MGKKKEAKTAKCDLCGFVGNDYVVLLVNPDPVKHEIWCDHCYTSTVIETQRANKEMKNDKQK